MVLLESPKFKKGSQSQLQTSF